MIKASKWLSLAAVAMLAIFGVSQTASAQIASISSHFNKRPGYEGAIYVGLPKAERGYRPVAKKAYAPKKKSVSKSKPKLKKYTKKYTKKKVYKKKTASKKKSYAKNKQRNSKRKYAKKSRASKSRPVKYRGRKGSLMKTLARVKPKGLPLRLAAAVVTVESGWRVNARGSSGERGLMQLMPATARSMGARGNLYNPTVNMRAGTKYLHYCYRRAKRNVAATIGCYNRGPGKMWAWSGNRITRRYVAKVRRYMGRA